MDPDTKKVRLPEIKREFVKIKKQLQPLQDKYGNFRNIKNPDS